MFYHTGAFLFVLLIIHTYFNIHEFVYEQASLADYESVIEFKYDHLNIFAFSASNGTFISQEAQARFARARLCLPYNAGRKETLRPK
jgi:hypothetical protein